MSDCGGRHAGRAAGPDYRKQTATSSNFLTLVMATGLAGIAAVEQDYVVADWRGTLPSDLQGAEEFLLLGGPPTVPGGMPDAGLMVSGMTEPPVRYDVTVTVATDGGYGPDPSGFAVAAGQAASSRNASVMTAHTW